VGEDGDVPVEGTEGERRIREQVARWRDDLLDLTGRNRLLRFRHTRTSSLEIDEPGAQAILDRLLSGRSREWTVHVPEDEVAKGELDPTAARVALGPADRRGSAAAPVLEALQRLGGATDGDRVWVSFGALRWQHDGTHTAALYLVPAELVQRSGWRLRLRAHELTVNPALLAHFEREFDFDLGDERYRIESAGIQSALDDMRDAFVPIAGAVDDRIGIVSAQQHAAMLEGQLDVTPAVLISEGPRDGVLAGLAGAETEGLPLLPTRTRVLGVPVPKPQRSDAVLRTTKATGKDVRAACAGLSRRAAGEFMDRGIWVLYLGIGMLHWSDPADGRAEFQDSPLLLVPVRLESASRGSQWKLLPAEEEALVNPALWLKLETELGIDLPDLDPEEPLEVDALLGAVRAAVADHDGWTVEERVVLSTFSFHKEAMYRDLRDNFERIVAHPIIQALASDPSQQEDLAADFDFDPVEEPDLDTAFPPERATTILDADASQRQCIAAAREGRSFVMDGPPGTGKSQTIANMIAELVSEGRTVLFVSEKAAALDVVHNRLARVGLDEYVLELHSHKTTRAVVAAALGHSLMRRPKPAPDLTEADLRDAERRRDALSRYARALNEPVESLGGRSLHHLLGLIARLQHLPQAPVARRGPAGERELTAVVEMGNRLRSTWEVVERGEDFAWRGATASDWNASVEQRVQARLDDAEARLEALAAVAEAVADDLLLDPPAGPREADDLVRSIAILRERPGEVPPGWLSDVEPAVLTAAAMRAAERARAWQAARADGRGAAGERWEEVDEPAVDDLANALDAAGVVVPHAMTAPELERLAARAEALAAEADAARAAAVDLAAPLGVGTAELTAKLAAGAVEVREIAAADHPPPAAWLESPEGLERARDAVRRLAPLLDAQAAAREAASAFEPPVLELDLEELARRFEEEHRGLKKLGGAYRSDRDTLAATAPGIKPKAAIARIGEALAWQKARRDLESAAGSLASVVGDAWSGPDTDRAVLERRLDLAERARGAVGGAIADPARFAAAVSGSRPVADLAERAARADEALARLRADVPAPLAPAFERPLDVASAALRRAAGALEGLAALTARVDAVRGSAGSAGEAVTAAQARAAAAAAGRDLAADGDASALGAWAALDADPDRLDRAVAWAAELRESLRVPPSRVAARRLTAAAPDAEDLIGALDRWRAALGALLEEFSPERREEVAADLDSHFSDAADLLAHLRATRGDIETWRAHAAAVDALAGTGLGEAVAFCRERRVPVGQVVDVLRRSALEAAADALLAGRREDLEPLRSVDRDRLVAEYAALDRRVVGDAAHRAMAAANARRPNTILGLATIIANEAQKKRKHMPVSHLLAKTAPVAQAIKPCFMMSPLSVSQFLAPDMHFDVVIFDEASQVRPSDAVNALYRGAAMIVAGDQKQLPPTSFFEQSTDDGDEWSEESLAEFDSVLDLAKGAGAFRSLSLRWHYRSRHEHLIAFSNHRFYGGELVTFPSPAERAHDLGVQLIGVEGVYRRGTSRDNPAEARMVADRVFAHAERGARSLGVVAFSEAQASFIEEVLRQDERRDDPRYADLFTGDRLAGLFVKNLENVQGDERDVIIFSVGYGPDEHGKLTMNFGPMNREGGWRRLNVAITRARHRVEIVCSFAPEQLAPGSRARGVDELRRYLEFAARGPVVLAVDDATGGGGEPESPFEQAVLSTLRSWGHDVVSQVGTAGYRIDMAVRHPDRPGRFALGIECDGAMYHSSRVARDRDRLREQVLEGLGWTLHRIWGPSWYRDRAGEERRLREAIDRALLDATPAAAPAPEPRAAPVVVDYEDVELDTPPAWAEPYVAVVLPPARAADPTDPAATAEIRALVLQTIAEEAPIVEDLLARRVIGAWGAVLSEKRRGVIRRALDGLVRAGTVVRDGNAFRLPNQRVDLVRVPVAGDERTLREVKQVPNVELAEAVGRLVAEARVVTEEEAQQKAARLFGWRRTGPAIAAALTRAVEQLAEEGVIVRAGDELRAADVRLGRPE
jgi:very-short-patch-repair endonuclease